jgi:hypothetical protein
MKKLILPGLFLIMACSVLKKEAHWPHAPLIYLAWNEDTVVSYRVAIFTDKCRSFLYTTEDTISGKKVVTDYRGQYRLSHDTIYLLFKEKAEPPMCAFMIRASGGYLSQQFKDHRKIMYLRNVLRGWR